jgi:sugar phosphate isomerase/epimerase
VTIGMCTATLLREPLGAPTEDELQATVDAAVAAGSPDLSVWAFQLAPMGDVRARGARVAAVEAATAWATGDPAATVEEAKHLVAIAAEHGSEVIAAVMLESEPIDFAHARDNLGLLVDEARGVGAQVCVEFLPWTGLPTLAAAWELVEPMGPGAGILLDTWHWQRQPGGPNPELLATIPGERIGYVQVCDAAPTLRGESFEEAMIGRLLPGEGVVDFASLWRVLDDIGAQPFVATEIFNTELVASRGSAGAATAMAEAARDVLGAS